MKKVKFTGLLFSLTALLLASCSNDDEETQSTATNSTLSLNVEGLEDLGTDFRYEGWLIVEGAPISTGTFSVDENGVLSQSQFEINAEQLNAAVSFVLSIEPVPDPSPDPADTKIFVGDFEGKTAELNTGTVASSFNTVSGKFIIATPTGTGAEEEANSGIWFLDPSSGNPEAGLVLPELAAGWKYEGWVVIDGIPVTTGTFTSVSLADESDFFSGENPGPPFPGEDFLKNAPEGLVFPTDLRGKTAVVSIEPFPDNSPSPFTLKPLASLIADDASGVQEIANNVAGSFPVGSVTR
ncbi:anti-sigma factor [uncultured Kriegella sp.]|uniref:anti-sigma factor n=1 Tax=uncultured Kriegella sp. TaxID=1798910 RepID=UPI0030DD1E8C|tara:strand:- start:170667 stop:171554 length:888 start_codon:yes stop_codon:yes gene_type:complete